MKTRRVVLTKEEQDILVLVAQNPFDQHLSNREIGRLLGIPVSRVKTLLHQACDKLGADNRNEAVLLAVVEGEMSLNELLSIEELAEILCTLDPIVLHKMTDFARQRVRYDELPLDGERIVCMDVNPCGKLTNRERDVLVLVRYGLTNKEIAETLFITTSAVRTFLYRAFNKLGARKRADAVQLASPPLNPGTGRNAPAP